VALFLFLLPAQSTADSALIDAPFVLTDDDDDPCLIRVGDFYSNTPGGWGTGCSGNNSGCYRDDNFDSTFPDGLIIGCSGGFEYTFTSSAAVEAFIPNGGPASVLPGTATDPTSGGGSLAGHLVAAKLSVGFDLTNPDFGASDVNAEDLEFEGGSFEGFSLGEVIALADEALGGCPSAYSLTDLVDALDTFNNAFVQAATNTGTMRLPGCDGCCGFEQDSG